MRRGRRPSSTCGQRIAPARDVADHAAMDLTKPNSWELRRPDRVLRDLEELLPFDVPRTLLARVDGRGPDQRLTKATELWRRPPRDELARTRTTERALKRLGLRWTKKPYETWPIVVAVVVRPGACWWSWDESEAHLGLRYGSNLVDTINGDIITVTRRGWYSQLDQLAGSAPAARWSPDAAA